MKEVSNFLETGTVRSENGNIRNFDDIRDELYQESGVETNVHKKENEEIERGGLVCLAYLNRRFDILSISRYFDVTKDELITFPPKGKKLPKAEFLSILRRASLADIVNANPAAKEVFVENGMQCTFCASSPYESVESAAFMHSRRPKDDVHGVNAVELCNRLVNALVDVFQEFRELFSRESI